jgi:hypothetical protein
LFDTADLEPHDRKRGGLALAHENPMKGAH